jgi:hypothetical protein
MEMYPGFVQELKTFALSPNRWMRRAAAVTAYYSRRKGLFHDDIFDIALLLLEDKDESGTKRLWLAVESQPQMPTVISVFVFVQSHKTKMPRTAYVMLLKKCPLNSKKSRYG